MPHGDLKYSADIALDAVKILGRIEQIIQNHDDSSGACKGRAYPAGIDHHQHVLVEISMLPKPHRNKPFINSLLKELEMAIKKMIPVPCYFSLSITCSGDAYVTNEHAP